MDEQPNRRDWSGIGCGVFLALFAVFFVYARWPDPEREVVRRREAFAEMLREDGAIFTPADPSRPEDAKLQISPRRQRLGDKPIRAITLPYGYPDAGTVKLKGLFPEATEWSYLPTETALVRVFGNAKAVEVLRHPDRVEVQRLVGKYLSGDTDVSLLASYPAKGDAFQIPTDVASGISAALLNGENFGYRDMPNCATRYGVRLTYFRGADRVDVLFCFECGVLETFWNQRSIHSQSFASYNLFAAAMKELFPHDEQIQAIKLRDERGACIDNPITPPAADSAPSATGSGQAPTPGR
jgi:hypothetical protein